MEFRLVYTGPLRSNGDIRHKQEIRRAIHPQLKELWKTLPLKPDNTIPGQSPGQGPISLSFPLDGFIFLPLVTQRLILITHLEILFFRREAPGAIVTTGGDIDNRIKTLLDALRMPRRPSEIPAGDSPLPDENPFFCLLEDDHLITQLHVDTDRLLEPGDLSSVRLILKINVKPTRVTWDNLFIT